MLCRSFIQKYVLDHGIDVSRRCISVSNVAGDLMEFFDTKANWSKPDVIMGRSWLPEELRRKSSNDLHKLWYILIKEKNMLLTMQYDAFRNFEPFANPERLDRVDESMENIEKVVGERNRAYLELETGNNGERPSSYVTTVLGFRAKKYLDEYTVPPERNENGGKEYEEPYLDDNRYKFQKLWREKLALEERDRKDDDLRERKIHKMVFKYAQSQES